jgi:hypothetical protein
MPHLRLIVDDERHRRRVPDISLFLFHVLEYIDVDYLIDESSERWRRSTRGHS